MSTGLALAALVWMMTFLAGSEPAYTLRRIDGYFLAWPLAVIVFFSLHILASSLQIGGHDAGRFVVSCMIFLFVCAGAHFASKQLLGVQTSRLVRASNDVLLLLAALTLAAAAGVPEVGPRIHTKPVVIFAEPSHLALAMLPVLLFQTAVSRRSTQFVLIGAALFIAATLQNLTLVAGTLFVAALLLRQTLLMLLLLIPLLATGLVMDLSYYSDRLTLSSDSTNVSTLVFLQGWENAILNFNDTHGLGVGFQQFGIAGSIGDIADKITFLLSGVSISLLDGGTTATKLIGEFGVFGILFLIGFVVIATRSILYLRRSQALPPASRDIRRIFFCSMIATYTIELFIRGTGYFSAGGFLALVSIISLARAGWRPLTVQRIATTDAPAAASP
jgi:hypothetical protein